MDVHGRTSRRIDWHGWAIAPIKGGGWGATCGGHKNSWDGEKVTCKKMLTLGSGPNKLTDVECRTRVKLWLLAGVSVDNSRNDARRAHVFGVNPRNLQLVTEADADAMAEAPMGSGAASSIAGPTRKNHLQSASAVGHFDAKAPDTPPDVVAELKPLIGGVIPPTTIEQRRKHRLTAGTSYGVPGMFRVALHAGYIHPDLPPPQGWVWRARPGRYILLPRGG